MADDPFRPLPGARRRAPAAAAEASKGDWIVCSPVPKNAPAPPAEHPKRGKPSRLETYRDARGDLLGHVARFDQSDGSKAFLPLTFCRSTKGGGLQWSWQSWPTPRPLYRLDQLAKKLTAPVIICEGEKSADAAAQLLPDHICITSPHGSQSASKADWSPLARRAVTIWPDADEPGQKYAETVARLLAPIAASVKQLDPPPDVKAGWDAADALAEGWDRARAEAFIAESEARKRGRPRRRRKAEGAGGGEDADEPRRRQADQLLDLIAEIELWHSPDRDPYATVPVKGHFENWPVRSKGFRLWLAEQFFRHTSRGASVQATEEALRTIESIAITNGAEHVPCLRLGTSGDDVYLDLIDSRWRVVRITAMGWEVVDRAPCKFLRTPAMAPLPEPEPGGSINELRSFVKLDDDAFMLSVAWLVQCFNPRGPYPVLCIYGDSGSGKTSFARLLRSMVDPSLAPDCAPPRDETALCLAAKNSWVLAIDNLSIMPGWLSDAMCRISTGGGIRGRVLYTNDEEVIFFLKRAQVFTAIPEAATRGDLVSRAISISMPVVPKYDRRTEAEYESEADKVRPVVLGALLTAAVSALRHRAEIPPVQLPRMADFATWIWRACPGLGWDDPKAFIEAYENNQSAAADVVFEADGLGAAITDFLALRQPDYNGIRSWTGTSTKLLEELPVDERGRRAKWWPAPNQVRNRLTRLQAALGGKGIVLDLKTRSPGRGRERLITITQEPEPKNPPAGV